MIGVPSAACSAKSFRPGAIFGAWGKRPGTSSERLAAPDHELVFLNGYIELVAGKSRHRQRDSQAFRLAVGAVAPLDIVGRIAVGALHDAIERTLDFVESQQERTG